MNFFNRFRASKPSPRKPSEKQPAAPTLRAFEWKSWFRFQERKSLTAFYDEVETLLIEGDVGGYASLALLEELKAKVKETFAEKSTLDPAHQYKLLHELLSEKIIAGTWDFVQDRTPVIALLGVNGTGKTTTLAKLAASFQDQYQVVLGAGDTFRAAAPEQLSHWAAKLNLPVIIKHATAGQNADSAAVAYDTVESALAKTAATSSTKTGMALIDTAGRLHNQSALMSELSKLFRVLAKFEDQIDLRKILVADVTQGQNITQQVKIFHEQHQLDGMILTKCDTAARGGSILALAQTLRLPVMATTFGETLSDIAPFDQAAYLKAFLPASLDAVMTEASTSHSTNE